MSYITDIVFMTNNEHDSDRFAELGKTLYTRYALEEENEERMEAMFTPSHSGTGNKWDSTWVFQMALNYADWELLEALRSEEWRGDTMLYIDHEGSEQSEFHTTRGTYWFR